MNEISKLIKEAKPLYFKQKKRNQRIKTTLGLMVSFAIFAFGSFGGYILGEQNANVAIDTSSQFEELGFPTDEYGLLTVTD